jgi:F0F1-type ATP synthase assembly protein I
VTPEGGQGKPGGGPRWLRASLQASTIGLTLIAATFIGFGIGLLLDRVFHTGFSHGRGVGWLTLLFSVLGVIAGFREMIRTVIRISEDEDRSAQ